MEQKLILMDQQTPHCADILVSVNMMHFKCILIISCIMKTSQQIRYRLLITIINPAFTKQEALAPSLSRVTSSDTLDATVSHHWKDASGRAA